jgi:hypothetical protein
LEAKVAALRAKFAEEESQVEQMVEQETCQENRLASDMEEMASLRGRREPEKGQGE